MIDSNIISSYNKFNQFEYENKSLKKKINIDENDASDCLTKSSELKFFINNSKIIYEYKIPNSNYSIHWINITQ